MDKYLSDLQQKDFFRMGKLLQEAEQQKHLNADALGFIKDVSRRGYCMLERIEQSLCKIKEKEEEAEKLNSIIKQNNFKNLFMNQYHQDIEINKKEITACENYIDRWDTKNLNHYSTISCDSSKIDFFKRESKKHIFYTEIYYYYDINTQLDVPLVEYETRAKCGAFMNMKISNNKKSLHGRYWCSQKDYKEKRMDGEIVIFVESRCKHRLKISNKRKHKEKMELENIEKKLAIRRIEDIQSPVEQKEYLMVMYRNILSEIKKMEDQFSETIEEFKKEKPTFELVIKFDRFLQDEEENRILHRFRRQYYNLHSLLQS